MQYIINAEKNLNKKISENKTSISTLEKKQLTFERNLTNINGYLSKFGTGVIKFATNIIDNITEWFSFIDLDSPDISEYHPHED